MKKVNLIYFNMYPKMELYSLANKFGRQLVDYLGKDMFSLLLDSKILQRNYNKSLYCISDKTYQIHPAAKALEGFLEKLLKNKKLKENTADKIGDVFGMKQSKIRNKIKDRRLIAKTKSAWDFCRNDAMHFGGKKPDISKLNDEIEEIIISLFCDFYGKSEPDEEISKKFDSESMKFFKKHSPDTYKFLKEARSTIKKIKKKNNAKS